MFIVELENNVFLSDGHGYGDPCRTTVRKNAMVFNDFVNAKHALVIARKYRPFLNAKICHFEGLAICPISGMTEEQSQEISDAMVKALQKTDYTNMGLIEE